MQPQQMALPAYPLPRWYNNQQQPAWGGAPASYNQGYPEPPEPPEPPEAPATPEIPTGSEGYDRVSRRVVVVPEGALAADVVEELNDVHGMTVNEKHVLQLDSSANWNDEEQFAAAINKAFKVKGGKSGPKFWKGVREAVMKLCATQDVLLFISGGGPADQVQALVKNVLEAAETKAVADSLVGLKSGKAVAVLLGWETEAVRLWPLVADDPMPAPPSREELARRHDPDDLSQYYAQSSRNNQLAPPRQVPPRQRQPFAPPAGRYPGPGPGGYGQQQYGRPPYGRDDQYAPQQYGAYNVEPPYGGPYDQYGSYNEYGAESHMQQQQPGRMPPHGRMGGAPPHAQPPNGFGGYGAQPMGQMPHEPPPQRQSMGQYPNGRGGNGGQWGWDGGGAMQQPPPPQQPPSSSYGGYGGGGPLNGGYGGGPMSGGYNSGASQSQSAMSMRAANERAAAELLWSTQMGVGGSVARLNGAGGGGPPAPPAEHYAAGTPSAQFGMSANAPSFTPGGGAHLGGGGGSLGGSNRGSSFSLEQESLREAAENLWGRATAAPAPAPAPAPRFTVPSSMDRVPSLSALEAESMRAAAAGLWGQTAAPVPAPAPSMDGLGMPPLPSALLGEQALPPACDGPSHILGGPHDPLGGSCDILASLSLDGGSEPSVYR